MTALDFELEIGPGVAGSYPVVARAPGGEVSTTLRWSLTPADLDHQLAVIKDKVLVSSTVRAVRPHRGRAAGSGPGPAVVRGADRQPCAGPVCGQQAARSGETL